MSPTWAQFRVFQELSNIRVLPEMWRFKRAEFHKGNASQGFNDLNVWVDDRRHVILGIKCSRMVAWILSSGDLV
jgi:hypothetical protein